MSNSHEIANSISEFIAEHYLPKVGTQSEGIDALGHICLGLNQLMFNYLLTAKCIALADKSQKDPILEEKGGEVQGFIATCIAEDLTILKRELNG